LDLLTALLQIIEATSEGIHLVDENGVTVVYNQAASEFDGLAPDEVIGKHLLDVFPSLDEDSSTLFYNAPWKNCRRMRNICRHYEVKGHG